MTDKGKLLSHEEEPLFQVHHLVFYANGVYTYARGYGSNDEDSLKERVSPYVWTYEVGVGICYSYTTVVDKVPFHETYQEAYRRYLAKLVLS